MYSCGVLSTVSASLVFWLCLCHLWIVLSSFVYMKIEGYEVKKTDFVESYLLSIFSTDTQKLLDVGSQEYKEFENGYKGAFKKQNYWQVRRKFNDISKVYMFVLSSVTTIGLEGMFLQTWQSQCFYLFSTPIGFLIYFIMIHKFGNVFYKVLLYAAASIFSKRSVNYTPEELIRYERFKVFIIAIYLFLFYLVLLALLALVMGYNYICGIYWILNAIFTINGPSLDFFNDFEHLGVLAIITSVIYFFGLELFYVLCFSTFMVFCCYDDSRLIPICNFGNHENESIKDAAEEEKELKAMMYLQAKMASEALQMKWDIENNPEETDRFFVPYNIAQYTDDSDTDSSSNNDILKVPNRRKRRKKRALKVNLTSKEPKTAEDIAPLFGPSIQVTCATPVDANEKSIVEESDK